MRACHFEEHANGVEELAQLLGPHPGADGLLLRVVGSALLAAVSVALELWQRDGGPSELLALLDQATDALTESMSELSPSSRGRDARGYAGSARGLSLPGTARGRSSGVHHQAAHSTPSPAVSS